MGNKKKPDDKQQVTPRTIRTPDPQGGGGGVVVDELPPPAWRFLLEDLSPVADRLYSGVAVRGEASTPRFRVYMGGSFVGFVPISESAQMREAMRHGATSLLGEVLDIELSIGRVFVELRLEGR